MRRMVAHHDHRRVILAAHQQSRFLPDRQRDRTQHAGHALAREPGFRAGKQRFGDRFVLGIEIAEKAGARAEPLFGRHGEREFVDMGRNPPDRAPAGLGDEQLHPPVAEERVLAGIDQFQLLGADLRDEIGQPVRKRPTAIDEGRPPALVRDRLDAYLGASGDCI